MSIIKPHGYDSDRDVIDVYVSNDQIALDVSVEYSRTSGVTALTYLTVDDAMNLVEALLDTLDIIDPETNIDEEGETK